MSAKSLPHNLDAERAVLGAVMISAKAMDAVSDRLTPEVFFRDAHRRVYKAMEAMYANGCAIDPLTLVDALRQSGDLDAVGGPAYVAGLTDGVPMSTNVGYYASIVRRTAAKRQIITLTSKLLDDAYDDDADASALIDRAEGELLAVSQQAVSGDLKPLSQMAREIFPVLELLQQSGRSVTGLQTGLSSLDLHTRGLQNGNLVILGGRPGHGKSTLGVQIALEAARHVPVAFFSIEMSQQEQMFRILATLAKVDGHRLQCGQLRSNEYAPVSHALEDCHHRKFWHDDTGSISALQIRSRARRLKARHGLGLIVVDYLQLLNHPKADSREERVAATGRLLKQIARELDVPLMALSQLARKEDRAGERRPQLSDLRESGALEQDADVVLLLHRPTPQSNGVVTETPPVELILAKQRNGPTASIDLAWLSEQYRFAELETRR
jgi:replicative DNA helicase